LVNFGGYLRKLSVCTLFEEELLPFHCPLLAGKKRIPHLIINFTMEEFLV